MKATKLIAIVAFAGFGLYAGEALAQGNDDAPPKMSDTQETEVATEVNTETVTIDNANADVSSTSGSASTSIEPERKERLRVYSGKHDGNNVIYDPRQ